MHTSYEFWRGTNNGAPIVAIATGLVNESTNRKTGAMIQTYILRQDMRPIEAANTGADAAICGNCPLRPSIATDVKCYVNKGWLTTTWESWRNGNVPRIAPAKLGKLIAGRKLRAGAYGDPAFVPLDVWQALYANTTGTGYTHQWETVNVSPIAMASVDTVADAERAQAKGWRTYRVDSEGLGPVKGEFMCPEATHGIQCIDCGRCDGNAGQAADGRKAKNIVIPPIGKRS
jgi:hypothetical protein